MIFLLVATPYYDFFPTSDAFLYLRVFSYILLFLGIIVVTTKMTATTMTLSLKVMRNKRRNMMTMTAKAVMSMRLVADNISMIDEENQDAVYYPFSPLFLSLFFIWYFSEVAVRTQFRQEGQTVENGVVTLYNPFISQ